MNYKREKPRRHKGLKQKSLTVKFKKLSSVMVGFYIVYLGKSALGINLLADYSAPQFLKAPFSTIDCILPIEGNYCHKPKRNIS